MNFISIIKRIIKSVLFGTLIVVCICSCGKNTASYLESEEKNSGLEGSKEQEIDLTETDSSEDVPINEVTVYICGEVNSPGVYTLPEGSRVCDIFELAGGLTKEAAQDYWNQARLLSDGEMIYVPTKEEAAERKQYPKESDTGDGKVNINTATKEELMTIPGIGEAKASAIIAYREKNGGFSKPEDIMKIEGIKAGVFQKMKDYIKIN